MTRAQALEALKSAIADETGAAVPSLSEQQTAADVPGWDSLGHVRIIMNLEARLGCEVDMDKTYRAATVGDLITLVTPDR